MRNDSTTAIGIEAALVTLGGPGSVTVLGPWLLHRLQLEILPFDIGFWRYAGLVPMAIGAMAYLWCAWHFVQTGRGTPASFAPPRKFVARGLYRYLRNPMYVGVILVLLGEGVWLQSVSQFAYAAAIALGFHLVVVYYEEPSLRRMFGDEYRDYCRRVKRWRPGTSG